MVVPHADAMSFEYAAQSLGEALVEDMTTSGEEIELDFGDVVEAAGFILKNLTGQDMSVALNGVLAGVPGSAVTDAATALGLVLTTQFGILNAFTGASSAATIVAAIATASSAIDTAVGTLTTALSTAADGADIFTLPDGGVLAGTIPPSADTPIESISVFTTTTQTGDGFVDFKIFGTVSA